MSPYRRLFLVVALLVLSLIPSAAPLRAADSSMVTVSPKVRKDIASDRARVLVQLRLPGRGHVPEGRLTHAAASLQRSDIAKLRGHVLGRLNKYNYRVVHQYDYVPLVALEIDASALAELEGAPLWVDRVFQDGIKTPLLPESVPLIGGDVAWGGCFHGTHVAGIATGNGAGAGLTFSGVAPGAQIMAVQVFSKFTSAADCGLFNTPCVGAYTSDLIAGLERVYAVHGTRNIASVNMSLGGGSFSAYCDAEPEKAIIDNLRSVGIATVVASGNAGSPNALSSPACISSAVSVGSTTKTDAVSSFSNVTPFMSLFAPGEEILSSVTGGGFAVLSGTSMATPHVAGSWAVLKQAAPHATVDQMLGALQSTGVPITDTRSGTPVTRPRIRVDLALDQLVPPTVTVTAVTPNNGKVGFAVPVTITGTGLVAGATINAGAGITVSNVVFVSSTQLTATFRIDGAATLGTRSVRVTLPTGEMATLSQGFTVNPAVTVTLAFNGKLRDKVGGGDTARTGDGALDGTLTMTLSATGGRTVTALRLSNGIGGVWDTTAPNNYWLLGVATSLDGPLLNDVTTMAVNTTVADGGSLRLFASDY